jgi:hypothetical protein
VRRGPGSRRVSPRATARMAVEQGGRHLAAAGVVDADEKDARPLIRDHVNTLASFAIWFLGLPPQSAPVRFQNVGAR